jgi:hypothetical protein
MRFPLDIIESIPSYGLTAEAPEGAEARVFDQRTLRTLRAQCLCGEFSSFCRLRPGSACAPRSKWCAAHPTNLYQSHTRNPRLETDAERQGFQPILFNCWSASWAKLKS